MTRFIITFQGGPLAVLVLFSALNAPLCGQASQPAIGAAPLTALPDVPRPQDSTGPMASDTARAGAAALSGTVVDTNGGVVPGARVALRHHTGADAQTIQSGSDGQFNFTGLAPGPYRLTVTAPGMTAYASPDIDLQAGDVRILPEVVLSVTRAETSVTVTADKEELAEEQVQIAVQQRVLGVLPNFYTTFDWNAPPMQAKQKFKLTLRSTFDPTAFLVIAGVAGAEQYRNIFPAYGSGLEGYGKRYGAAFANHVTAQFFSRAIYPSLFHQDPRYFYKGKGSVTSRALYAISAAVISRNDNGRWGPNYSNVLGNFTSGAISNLYYPESDRGASLVFLNGLVDTAADAAENLVKEFVLKDITSHAPPGD